ncbi:hypothetical protein D3C87_1426960 [compost metagenome]
MVHLGRAGQGAEIGPARGDVPIGCQRAINLARVHLEELGQDDIGKVGAAGQSGAGGHVVAGNDVEHGLVGQFGSPFEEGDEVFTDIVDDQAFQRRRQHFGATQYGGALGPRLRAGSGEQPGRQRLELFHFGNSRLAAPRIGVAGRDQEGVGAINTTRFDQQLKGLVGLKSKHFRRNHRLVFCIEFDARPTLAVNSLADC